MTRYGALFLSLMILFCAPVLQAGTIAEQAAKAARDLSVAVETMQGASKGKDRIKALTLTIQAYEDGLAALRGAMREATLREAELTAEFAEKRDKIARLLGVLSGIDGDVGPALLIHPTGPLGTIRSGMMLADVTPALQAEADRLANQLAEMTTLKTLQTEAGRVLANGLTVATEARSALSQAISDRTDLPTKFTEDPEKLRGLLESADTLDAFATGLVLDKDSEAGFALAKGKLDLPVRGRVLLKPYQTDAAGIARPGYLFLTRRNALVTAPWAATVRYSGPFLDYGNVMILEPGDGYLLIIGGLDQVYRVVGEVVPTGAALGLMGERDVASADLVTSYEDGSGADETERLYLELRAGSKPVDPTDWFASLASAL